ncbi:hypothetical protein [Pseudoduganella sp. UC29_71]|uniref:hypothetical protein n=1 Tax=Pseudoduganella sp. UC29_71 TaxID=3350174 RepID=UPI003670F185
MLTFVLQLGDWPFLDEVLEEQSLVQHESVVASQTNPVAKPDRTQVSHAADLYASLSNLADMPVHYFFIGAVEPDIHQAIVATNFTSASPIPLDRPPIFS